MISSVYTGNVDGLTEVLHGYTTDYIVVHPNVNLTSTQQVNTYVGALNTTNCILVFPEYGLMPIQIVELVEELDNSSYTVVIITHSPVLLSNVEVHKIKLVTKDGAINSIKDLDIDDLLEYYAFGSLYICLKF